MDRSSMKIEADNPKAKLANGDLNENITRIASQNISEQDIAAHQFKQIKTINTPVNKGTLLESTCRHLQNEAQSNNEALGLTLEQIEELWNRDQLIQVLCQVKKIRENDNLKRFFKHIDSSKLPQLLYDNAMGRPSSRIGPKSTKYELRSNTILLQKKLIRDEECGSVYKISYLDLEKLTISYGTRKKAFSFDRSIQLLKNEYDWLRFIDNLAKNEGRADVLNGIQHPPSEFQEGSEEKISPSMSWMDTCYEKNIFQINLNRQATLRAYKNAIFAIAFLQEKGVVHLKIEITTILCEPLGQKEYNFRLSGFSESNLHDNLKSLQKVIGLSYAWTTKNEVPNSSSSLGSLNQLSTFNLGITLYQSLFGTSPYRKSSEKPDCMDTSLCYCDEDFIRGSLPESICTFIKSLINPDPAKRPTGRALQEAWGKLIQENPEIFNVG